MRSHTQISRVKSRTLKMHLMCRLDVTD